MKKILYHGGSHIIIRPEIREPLRTLDFGKGFYVTSSQSQAERWCRTHLRGQQDIAYVNLYEFDLDTLPADFKIKIFEKADEEWVDFVLANRVDENFSHDFDIVYGPVANDRVYTQFSLFEGGIISKETLIRELKAYKLVDQYVFHTPRALDAITYKSHYEVRI